MTTKPPANARARLIKLIHVARRELNMDEPTYRTVLQSAGNAQSTTLMKVSELLAVLERLQKSGFVIRPKSGDRRQTINPDASKIRALWLFLHVLGVVRDPSEKALATYVKRIAKVDDLRWARGDATTVLIETLKKWAMRYLPAAVSVLKDDVVMLHKAKPLDEAQMRHVQHARACLSFGEGFDAHWWAWESLMRALGRDVSAGINAVGSKP